jgi:hypothetical protein
MSGVVQRVEKVAVAVGRIEAFIGALCATVFGGLSVAGGIMKILRDREPQPRDPQSRLRSMDDIALPGWVFIVIGVLLIAGAWLWFAITMKWRAAAIVEAMP